MTYGRLEEWNEFSKIVSNHIAYYANSQYGDLNLEDPSKGDQLQSANIQDLQTNLKRYVNRMTSGARGHEETIRDLYKIAHYACIAWGKYNRSEVTTTTKKTFKINNANDIINLVEEIKKHSICNVTIEA